MLGGLHHRPVTEGAVAFDDHGSGCFMHQLNIGVGIEFPFGKGAGIAVDRTGAVAAHSAQIRVDQQAANGGGVFGLQADFLEAGNGKGEQSFFPHLHK